jgi:hypothetical protein
MNWNKLWFDGEGDPGGGSSVGPPKTPTAPPQPEPKDDEDDQDDQE